MLQQNNMKKYAIGVDLGGTFIKFGLVSSDGQLVYENIAPTSADAGAPVLIAGLINSVKECLSFAQKHDFKVEGIGIGTPGLIDRTNRKVLGGADNIKGWSNIDLSNLIEAECGLSVSIINDANAMGLGEQCFGAARDCTDVLFLTIGTGIGGAVIIDGKLFCGYGNRGTELGHIPLFTDGIPCSCGSVGCLETYASTSALVKQFTERCDAAGIDFQQEINGQLIVELYHQNHPVAVATLEDHWRFLGRGIAGLVNIFSPQLVVIGGGISEAGSFYMEKIDEQVKRFVMPDCMQNTRIRAAMLGNKAGILGAARWAVVCPNKK